MTKPDISPKLEIRKAEWPPKGVKCAETKRFLRLLRLFAAVSLCFPDRDIRTSDFAHTIDRLECYAPSPPAHFGGCLSWKSISPALGTSSTPSSSRSANSSALMLLGPR